MAKIARLRVRIKGEGNFVALVQPTKETPHSLIQNSKWIVEEMPENMDGYFVAAWNENGEFTMAYRTGKIGPRMSVALIKEIASSEISSTAAMREMYEEYE